MPIVHKWNEPPCSLAIRLVSGKAFGQKSLFEPGLDVQRCHEKNPNGDLPVGIVCKEQSTAKYQQPGIHWVADKAIRWHGHELGVGFHVWQNV